MVTLIATVTLHSLQLAQIVVSEGSQHVAIVLLVEVLFIIKGPMSICDKSNVSNAKL